MQPWIGTNIHLAFGPLKLASDRKQVQMTIIARRNKSIFDLPALNRVSERVLIVCKEPRDEDDVRLAARKIIMDNGYINAVSVRYIKSLYEEYL